MSTLIMVHCNSSNNFLVEPFSFTINCVDPYIVGKRVGEHNTQQFSSHKPGDDESILPIVTLLVHTTSLSIMNAAIAGLPDPGPKI
jgi:hypothetical protein